MRLGIHDFEKERPQSVSVSVRLTVDPEARQGEDDIADAVSYSDVAKHVRSLMAGPPIALVETFAERIAAGCMTDPRVTACWVRVCKNAIVPDSEGVGVEMTFRR